MEFEEWTSALGVKNQGNSIKEEKNKKQKDEKKLLINLKNIMIAPVLKRLEKKCGLCKPRTETGIKSGSQKTLYK